MTSVQHRTSVRIALWLVSAALWLGLWHCSPPNDKRPQISIVPGGGSVKAGSEVRIESDISATVYYTLDETYPEPVNSMRYRGPIRMWSSVLLRAVAYNEHQQPGPEARVWFQVDTLFPQSTASPRGGHFHDSLDVLLRADEASKIHYTLDGNTPTLQSPIYMGPLRISQDTVLQFFGVDHAGNQEPVQREEYNFSPKLQAVPPSGVYQERPLSVSLRTNEEKAVISYNVLSSRSGWQIYQQPLSLEHDTHLQVRAEDEQGWISRVEDVVYSLIRPFSLRPMLANTEVPLVVASVDLEGFDGSGLVMATRQYLWIIPEQAGQFQPPKAVAALSFTARWIRSWDLNGDGLSDVMIGDSTGKLHVYRGVPGSTLVADDTLLPSLSFSPIRRIVPLDYDGDGQLDLLALDMRQGQSRLLKRTPEGYQPQPPLTNLFGPDTKEALAGDYNNDRKTDILVIPAKSQAPYVLLGDGKGGFRSVSLYPMLSSFPSSTEWLHALRTDMDGDGELDLVLVGRSPASSSQTAAIHVVLLRHLDGEYWRLEASLLLPDAPVRGCMPVDFDSDGYPDIVLWLQNQPPVLVSNFLGKRLFVVEPKHLPQNLPIGTVGTVSHVQGGGLHSLLWGGTSSWQALIPQGTPRYLHLLLQGIQGNRNAIGTQIRILTKTSPFVREIGIRSTGPDQASLFFPIPFDNSTSVQSIKILWSDGQNRDISQPTFNQPIVIRPHE